MSEKCNPDPLFSPLLVNKKWIRNRFVLPAMQRKTRDYAPTLGMADTLRKCAEDGAGLIIAEGAAPDHPAAYWQPRFRHHRPRDRRGLASRREGRNGNRRGYFLCNYGIPALCG